MQRGNGVLAILGSWLLEPQGYDRVPAIDIRMATAPGLVFAAGLPKVGEAVAARRRPRRSPRATQRWVD